MGNTNSTGGWMGPPHIARHLNGADHRRSRPTPRRVEAFVTEAGEIALRGADALTLLCRHEAGDLARTLLECADRSTAPCAHP
jgi:hypothetical protein